MRCLRPNRGLSSALFQGGAAFATGALLTTERELRVFDERFPVAPASALLRGQVLLALEEFEAQHRRLTWCWPPMHQPEALLYRMRAVSQLGDAARGEAASDRLVTLGTWYQARHTTGVPGSTCPWAA